MLTANIAAAILGPIGGICFLIAILRMMAVGAMYSGAGWLLAVSLACFGSLMLMGVQ
jgi:hypothetical protein